MPAPLLDKEELLSRVLAVFRAHGYDGASLARLQEATGLGRGSLYHHFPGGKEEMADLVLADVAAYFEAEVLAPLAEDGPLSTRLDRVVMAFDQFYEGGAQACLVDVLTIGDAQRTFGPKAAALMDALAGAIKDALIRAGQPEEVATGLAEDALIRLEGALVLVRARSDTGVFSRTLKRVADDLNAVPD